MPSPFRRQSSLTSPKIQTPGRFISTITSARSAGARNSTPTPCGDGTGLPSSAITVMRWPGSASLTFSVAPALSSRNSSGFWLWSGQAG